jgi:hypothetical protein
LFLIVFSRSSAALSAEDLIFDSDQAMVKPTQLTRAEVQEDLELLDLALRKGYEGPNFRDRLNRLSHEKVPPNQNALTIAINKIKTSSLVRSKLN